MVLCRWWEKLVSFKHDAWNWVLSDQITLFLIYILYTRRNQVLVQSQCYYRFLVGSTGKHKELVAFPQAREPIQSQVLRQWIYFMFRFTVADAPSTTDLFEVQQSHADRSIDRHTTHQSTTRAIQKHKEPSAFQSIPQHPMPCTDQVRAASIHPDQP